MLRDTKILESGTICLFLLSLLKFLQSKRSGQRWLPSLVSHLFGPALGEETSVCAFGRAVPLLSARAVDRCAVGAFYFWT